MTKINRKKVNTIKSIGKKVANNGDANDYVYVPIGADSDNVDRPDGMTVEESLSGIQVNDILDSLSNDSYKPALASGYRSIAMGANAVSTGSAAISIGPHANTFNSSSIAIGAGSKANLVSIAVGEGASAINTGSIAIGSRVEITGDQSTCIGHYAKLNGSNSMAIGVLSNISGNSSVAISSNVSASDAIGIGYSRVIGNGSIAIGGDSASQEYGSISIGRFSKAFGECTVALGISGSSAGRYSTAIGAHANASGNYSTAIGMFSNASGNNSTAIGAHAFSSSDDNIQLGNAATISSITSKVPITVTSDERDKTDISEIKNNAIDFLNKIKAIRYVFNGRELYIDEENLSDKERMNKERFGMCLYDKESHKKGVKKGQRIRVGVSAQNVQNALKEVYGDLGYANLVNDNLFDYDPDEIPEGVENQLSVNYEGFIPFIIQAIHEISDKLMETDKALDILQKKGSE